MEDVICKFRNGDPHAFEELFLNFFSAGRGFVKTFSVEDDVAEDILQEVFIQMWNRRSSFKNENHFKAYFYKSLRNNTVKFLTRKKESLNIKLAEQKEDDDLFVKIIEIEFKREILLAISNLPEKRREIILLSIKGMSVEQIADALGISINTVKSQKTKAYKFLRKELEDIGFIIFLISL